MRAILFTLCLSVISALAQPPDTLWTRILTDSSGTQVGNAVCQLADGDFAIAGYHRPFAGSRDMLLLRMSASGEVLWRRTYGDELDQEASDMLVMPDGGFALAGYTTSADSTYYYLVRTDSTGDTLWTRRYGFRQNSRVSGIDLCADNGFILGGMTRNGAGPPGSASSSCLVRTNSMGDILWTRCYSFSIAPGSACNSVMTTSSGGFLLGGSIYDEVPRYAYICSVDSSGEQDSFHLYTPGPGYAATGGIAVEASDGSRLLVGQSAYSYWQSFIARWTPLDSIDWQIDYPNGTDFEHRPCAVSELPGGGLCVAGIKYDSMGTQSAWLMQVDSTGNVQWEVTLDSWTNAYDMVVTQDNGLIVAGRSIYPPGGVYVARLESVTGTPQYQNQLLPKEFTLSSYPNPFNPETTIEFDIPLTTDVSLKVYNVQGRLVSELVNETVSAGSHQVVFDGSGYPSGLYFARLQAGEYTKTHKLMLIK